MRNILIFQHVGHEPLGTLNPLLKGNGFRIRYVNFGRDSDIKPSLEGYNGLVVLGGPMGVYDTYRYGHLLTEMKLIEQALKLGIPVLGICLGAQMMAHVLGAPVRRADQPEFGWYPIELTSAATEDALFKDWKKTERVFQARQDFFDIPKGAVHLASGASGPGQGFRYGKKAYGLQFHLEVDQAMIHRWLRVSQNQAWIAESKGRLDLPSIEKETEMLMPRSLELSRATFSSFVEIFQLRPRQVILGSGHGKPTRAGV